MSTEEVDEYLHGLEEPKHSTLEPLRSTILEIVPDAEQVISYRCPRSASVGRRSQGSRRFAIT